METKEILLNLRTQAGLSQEELSQKLFVTRQAVSRWETGETIPNTDTLKQLSKLYNVSINTLLGSPRKLICQCCGMLLEDDIMSKETDGSINEDYCKWCYKEGEFIYNDMESIISFCENTMSNETFTREQVRDYMSDLLPKLKHWSSNR